MTGHIFMIQTSTLINYEFRIWAIKCNKCLQLFAIDSKQKAMGMNKVNYKCAHCGSVIKKENLNIKMTSNNGFEVSKFVRENNNGN